MRISYLATSENGIESYKIENANGAYAVIITYGARIANLCVPCKDGSLVDVVAGFENPDGFMSENPYFNAVIGRVCNRIGGAKFTLDGKEYNLFKTTATIICTAEKSDSIQDFGVPKSSTEKD